MKSLTRWRHSVLAGSLFLLASCSLLFETGTEEADGDGGIADSGLAPSDARADAEQTTPDAGSPTLGDEDLLARYYMDEAGSGTSPPQLLDSAPISAADMRIHYEAAVTFAGTAGRRGLAWLSPLIAGRATVEVRGTSLSALLGSTKLTLEFAINLQQAGSDDSPSTLLQIGSADVSLERDFSLQVFDSGATRLVRFTLQPSSPLRTWAIPQTPLHFVLHVVLDTTAPVDEDRLRLFLNGEPVDASQSRSIALNAELVIADDAVLAVGNSIVGGPSQSPHGRIGYVALYDQALAPAVIENNHEVLAASDDSPQ